MLSRILLLDNLKFFILIIINYDVQMQMLIAEFIMDYCIYFYCHVRGMVYDFSHIHLMQNVAR